MKHYSCLNKNCLAEPKLHRVLSGGLLALMLVGIPSVGAISDNLIPDPNQTQLLLKEGFIVSGRVAQLVRHPEDQRWFAVFEPEEQATQTTAPDPLAVPIEVLSGKWLTAMNRVTENQIDLSIKFRIWGEITTFNRRNFILPTYVATVSLFGKEDNENKPALAPTGQDNAPDKLPEKFRQALLKIKPVSPLELLGPADAELREEDTEADRQRRERLTLGSKPDEGWLEGEMVIDRVGRVLYDNVESCWLFTFDADNQSMAEPPVLLHPCQLLEVMASAEMRMSHAPRFRISGQITKYKGQNYMLLRKVLFVIDQDNLGR